MKNQIKIFFAIILLLQCAFVNAQYSLKWVDKYNSLSNNDDVSTKVIINKSTGDVYITGSSFNNTANYDITTIKYNSEGIVQWVKSYNGTGNGIDLPKDMVLDNNGNALITGISTGQNSQWDCITLKYSEFGDLLWARRYNGPGNSYDEGSAITFDKDGNIFVTGHSVGFSSFEDVFIVKYNDIGDELWLQRYNGTDNEDDGGNSIVCDNENNIYITGYSDYPSASSILTIKYSSVGNQKWVRKYNTQDVETGLKSLIHSQGGQIVSIGKSGTSLMMIAYDFSGEMRWKESPDGRLTEFSSAAIDNNENIYLCGICTTGISNDYITLAYKPSGSFIWSDIYDNAGFDKPHSITTDNDNNVYVAGQSRNVNGIIEYAALKYSDGGTRQWIARYGYPRASYNIPSSISVDYDGNVAITGYCMNLNGNHDYLTIKYTQENFSLKSLNGKIPSYFKLHQNYPNPFNPSTNIKFDIPWASNIKITVYDILGREVEVLANEFKQAGSYEVNHDASALSSGTYFYKLTAGEFSDIKKMILIK